MKKKSQSIKVKDMLKFSTNQSGAAEAWWAHNPQVPGSKPGSDTSGFPFAPHVFFFFKIFFKPWGLGTVEWHLPPVKFKPLSITSSLC